MKKYIVIGNPIKHSLSPALHNYWLKKNNINAIYDKILLNESDLENIISKVKKDEIHGLNITVPFKKSVIPFLDELTAEADESKSVNTIYKENNKIIGHNTDIAGFELGIRHSKYDLKNKKIFILGAGGVVPSIILALKKLGASKISLSNRTKEKAKSLKKIYSDLEIVEWGEKTEFDMIINATSLGLKNEDEINIDYKKCGKNKLFYDVIYNPSKTNFLSKGEELNNRVENGKMMFIYQAQLAFKILNNILPEVDEHVIKLMDV